MALALLEPQLIFQSHGFDLHVCDPLLLKLPLILESTHVTLQLATLGLLFFGDILHVLHLDEQSIALVREDLVPGRYLL
jgi:hypothetical protein